MSLFSSLFGKKTPIDADSPSERATDSQSTSVPAVHSDVLSPPPIERKPFVLPPGSEVPNPQAISPEVPLEVPIMSAVASQPVEVPSTAVPEKKSEDESEKQAELIQMETDLMTREDVIAAYKIFLRRRPVVQEDIEPRLGMTGDRVLFDYLMCDEFTNRPEIAQLIFNCAKKIVDSKKSAAPANTAAGVETSSAQEADAEPVPGLHTGKPSL